MYDDVHAHRSVRIPSSSALRAALISDFSHRSRPFGFRTFKVLLDMAMAILALPIIAVVGVLVFVANPWLNPGPLFFRQERMGRDGKIFIMWKFRTMVPGNQASRAPNEPLESDRITRLGKVLRITRLDELPNFFNVLRGEMSLVGPRPDAASHALHFMETVPGYRQRLRVAPGITGLAQVKMGYASGEEETARKTAYDVLYVRNLGYAQEFYIIARTVWVMVAGLGR